MSRKLTIGWVFCWLILSVLFPVSAQETATPPEALSRPLPIISASSAGTTYERYFESLDQGQVGLLRLTGDSISAARALFRGREYPYVQHDDGWYALLVGDIDAQPREYGLSVLVQQGSGETVAYEDRFAVLSGGFVRQNFDVPPPLAYLIDPQVERGEYARLDALIDETRPQALWGDAGWSLPMDAPISSAFGQYRILNGIVQTRHTGWDQSVPVGTPIRTMAAGEVVYAARLDIRGNYVLIDHGWGVFSGYAHLSQINVQRGQSIESGQIIGASGNTGRSSGPHLHWEIAVNGEWIDGLSLIEMWLP